MFHDLLFRLRAFCRRRAMETELDAELQAHLEHQAEKYIRGGQSREEAERRARLDFGDIEQVKEDCRHSWGVLSPAELMAGLHNGFRLARRSPGFTAAAAAALVVGFVINMAMFNDASAVVQQLSPHANSAPSVLAVRNTTPKPAVVSAHSLGFVGPKAPKLAPVRAPHRSRAVAPSVRRKPAFLRVTIVTVRSYRYQSPAGRVEETVWTSERGRETPNGLVRVSERGLQPRPASRWTVLQITVRFTGSRNAVLKVLPGNCSRPQEDAGKSMGLGTSGAQPVATQGRILTTLGRPGPCTSFSQGLSNL